jgi:hypothetical protein
VTCLPASGSASTQVALRVANLVSQTQKCYLCTDWVPYQMLVGDLIILVNSTGEGSSSRIQGPEVSHSTLAQVLWAPTHPKWA